MGQQSSLSGYGCGLPLARLYAQYFGGHIDLKSMEGGPPKKDTKKTHIYPFFITPSLNYILRSTSIYISYFW